MGQRIIKASVHYIWDRAENVSNFNLYKKSIKQGFNVVLMLYLNLLLQNDRGMVGNIAWKQGRDNWNTRVNYYTIMQGTHGEQQQDDFQVEELLEPELPA